MDKKYQIFVSSTYTDLKEVRLQVLNTILTMRHIPAGMELFGASNFKQKDIIEKEIRSSDYYILILGHRYGSLTESGISYTEMEFDFARNEGIPILAFIRDRDVATKPSERDSDPLLISKLDKFRNKVLDNCLCEFWVADEELYNKISISLNKAFLTTPRPGWSQNVETNSYLIDYLDVYLEEKLLSGRKKISLKNYKTELSILANYFKETVLEDIDVKMIKGYLNYRKVNYNIESDTSLQTIRSIIRTFFEWLKDEGIISLNPVSKVNDYKKIRKSAIKEILTPEQLDNIRINLKTCRENAMIEVFLATGCKLDEFLNLKISNLDKVKRTLTIEKSNKSSRMIPLNDICCLAITKYLNERVDDIEFLFITERKPFRQLTRSAVQFDLKKIASRCALKEVLNTRILRNTFARTLNDKGCPLNIAQALLGHEELSNTRDTFINLDASNMDNVRRFL